MKAAYLLTAFIAGAFLGFVMESVAFAVGSVVAVIALRFAISLLQRNPLHLILCSRLLTIWAALLLTSLGILDSTLHPASTFIPSENSIYQIEGEVKSRRTLSLGESYVISLRSIDRRKEIGRVNLFTPADAVLIPGDVVSFSGKIKLNDTPKFAERSYTVFLHNSRAVRIIESGRNLTSLFYGFKEKVNVAIDNAGLNAETTALMRALLLADRSSVDKKQIQNFKNGGAIHILAVSGMHIGIIAIILLQLTLPLTLVVGRKFRYLIVICGVWAFVLLTGAPLSAVRAALMLSIAVLAWMMERRRDAFSAVCFSALIILMWNPKAMFDIGLQLSFVSVASLTLLAEQLNPIDHRSHPAVYRNYSLIVTTLIATSATWMLCGYYFGSVPLRFLPSNLLLLPLLPFYMLTMIVYLFLSVCGLEFSLLGQLIEKVPEWLYAILDRITVPSLSMEIGITSVILWLAAMSLLAIAVNIDRPGVAIRSFPGATNDIENLLTRSNSRKKTILFSASAILALLSILLIAL